MKIKFGNNWFRLCGITISSRVFKKRKVIGYDINENRIRELNDGIDSSREFTKSEKKKIQM